MRLVCVVVLAAGSVACVGRERCDAALESASHARAAAADRELARLALSHAQLAAEVRLRGGDEREALTRRLTALEAENAELSARLTLAEREVARARRAAARSRPLDTTIPYTPRDEPTSGRDEGSILRRATRPRRQLDEAVPYAPAAPAPTTARVAEPNRRTLDEVVPY